MQQPLPSQCVCVCVHTCGFALFQAAFIGAQQLVLTKLSIELLDNSIQNGNNQMLSPTTYAVIIAAIATSLIQVRQGRPPFSTLSPQHSLHPRRHPPPAHLVF